MLSQALRSAHGLFALGCLALIACQHGRGDGHVGWSAEELALESACRAGERDSCRDLGGCLVGEKRPERDLQRGLVLLELTCGQDDWKACWLLGDVFVDLTSGDGQRRKLGRAVDVLGRACAHGIAAACTRQGDAILLNASGERGPARAAFLAGCEQGDARGCEAFAIAEMRSPKPDMAKVESGLVRACEQSRPEACFRLGSLLWRSPARRGDAIRLWQIACDKGSVESCRQLSSMGESVPDSRPAPAE
jgi:TPR repeat protein